MKQIEHLFILTMLLFTSGSLWAVSDVAQFAQQQETAIQECVAKEKLPLRQQQTEFLLRQRYAIRIEQLRKTMLRSGKLTTDEVEQLRKQREALLTQLETLDQAISVASLKAPEMIELQAIEDANRERIKALHKDIMPESDSAKSTDAQL